MTYDGFHTLRVSVDRGVATVTIDHGEINLFDIALIGEMDRVSRILESAKSRPTSTPSSGDAKSLMEQVDRVI